MQLEIRLNSASDSVQVNGRRYDRSQMAGRDKRKLRRDVVRMFSGHRPRATRRLHQQYGDAG